MQASSIENHPSLTREERARLRELAAKNARALGLADEEWQRRRKIENAVICDILMAYAPDWMIDEASISGKESRLWSLRRMRIDELVAELREAAHERNATRLSQLLDELQHRKTKAAARLAASARLSLLAIERPEVLPFHLSDAN